MSATFFCLSAALLAAAPVEAPKPAAARQAAAVRLAYRFTPGEILRYRVEHKVENLAVKGELSERSVTSARTAQHFEVVSVDAEGVATLRLVIDGVRMEAAFDAEPPVVFDSASDDAPPRQYASVGRIVGQPLTEVRVRPDGSLAATRALLSADDQAALGGVDRTAAETNGLFDVFPGRTLAVGDEWADTYRVKISVTQTLRREVTLRRTYRLERLARGKATITFRTALLTPLTDPQQLVQLLQRQHVGSLTFDVAAGRPIHRQFASDNTELGWAGPDSSLRTVASRVETLVTDEAVSAK